MFYIDGGFTLDNEEWFLIPPQRKISYLFKTSELKKKKEDGNPVEVTLMTFVLF